MTKKEVKRSVKSLPWGKILLWVILLAGISGFFDADCKIENALFMTAVSVIGLLICYRKRLFGKRQKAAPKASIAPTATSTSGKAEPEASATTAATGMSDAACATISIEGSGRTLSYRLAGVTFQGRQKWLKKIYQKQEEYDFVPFELEPYEWEGKPACRVLAYIDGADDPVDIGSIPATAAANVCELIDRVTGVDVEVYGGPEYEGDDKSYGAEVTIAYK